MECWVAQLIGSACGDAALLSMESGCGTIFDFVHSDDVANITTTFNLLRAGNRSLVTVFRMNRQDGFWVQLQWSRLHGVGEEKGWVGVVHPLQGGDSEDLAIARHAADAANQQSHALTMSHSDLAAFASAASHDLRAPLRAIHGFCEIVCEDYDDALDETGNDYLQRIASVARRFEKTIDGVTHYLWLDGDGCSFRLVDLNKILQEVAELHQCVEATIPGTVTAQCLPTVHGDPIQLKMLVEELVANGLVHNQAEVPAVTVLQSVMDPENDRVVDARRVVIVVSDNGQGVQAKDRQAIFSPFRKMASVGDASGLGLGLAMARRIVQRHGGDLRCLGGNNGGCRFVFDLQVVPSSERVSFAG